MHRDKLPAEELKQRRAENTKRYYAANRDACLERTRTWQKRNTDHVNEKRRFAWPTNAATGNAANLAWRQRNPDKVKNAKLAYRAGAEGRARDLVTSAKRRAKLRAEECTVSLARVTAVVKNGFCEATGLPFVLSPGTGRSPFTPSLDRRDCTKGYTDYNTRVVVWALNMACGDFGEEVLWQIVKARWPDRVK